MIDGMSCSRRLYDNMQAEGLDPITIAKGFKDFIALTPIHPIEQIDQRTLPPVPNIESPGNYIFARNWKITMEFIKFFLADGKIIDEVYDKQRTLFILADFLKDGIREEAEYVKKWLDDSTSFATGVLYEINLEKVDNKIILRYGWAYDLPLEEQNIFETTKEQLHYIIDRWLELRQQKPKEILLTRDGDKVTIEGKF